MRKQLATLATAAALAAIFTLFGCKEEKAKTPEAVADTVPQAEETAATEDSEVSYLISAAGVGVFQYGKPIPFDNKDYAFKEETLSGDGGEWSSFSVYQNGEKVLRVELDSCHADYKSHYSRNNNIKFIQVLSGKFATAKGIKVGSAVEDFAKAYPDDLDIRYSEIEDQYRISSGSVIAEFSPASLPKSNDNLKLSDVKGSKIAAIRIIR